VNAWKYQRIALFRLTRQYVAAYRGELSFGFPYAQSNIFKKPFVSHVRMSGNLPYAKAIVHSINDKDSHSKMAQPVPFEGLYAPEYPRLDPRICPASEKSSAVKP
jgi:hypothetical protein